MRGHRGRNAVGGVAEMNYRARNCSGWPMSTGQGIKSAPAKSDDREAHRTGDAFSGLPMAIVFSLLIWLLMATVWTAI